MTDNPDLRSLLAENAALRHGLPDELRSVLKGDTREEIDAHAGVLAKFAPAEAADDPEIFGGLDAHDLGPEDRFDPAEVARRIRSRRY